MKLFIAAGVIAAGCALTSCHTHHATPQPGLTVQFIQPPSLDYSAEDPSTNTPATASAAQQGGNGHGFHGGMMGGNLPGNMPNHGGGLGRIGRVIPRGGNGGNGN